METNKSSEKRIPDLNAQLEFLEEDLLDSLKWLFVGAITWQADKERPQRCPHQRAIGMFTSIVQARSLYDFYYKVSFSDDARAKSFATDWTPKACSLLDDYLGNQKAANKRIFHLVYWRSERGGGKGDESCDINEQVLELAKEVLQITRSFVESVDPHFREAAHGALRMALKEAQDTATAYDVENPFKV